MVLPDFSPNWRNPKEWHSTWTNLAYLAIGIAALWTNSAQGILVAVGSILLTLGSASFHSKLTRYARAADECAMYICFAAVVGLGFGMPATGFAVGIGLAAIWDKLNSFVVVPLLVVCALIPVWAKEPGAAILLACLYIFFVLVRQWAEGKSPRIKDPVHGWAWHNGTSLTTCLVVAAYALL